MEVCGEMLKLRNWLDDNKIRWEDRSGYIGITKEGWICRTGFYLGDNFISVINGYGTYGGFFLWQKDNKGLLEVMGLFPDVEGYLTADEIIQEIQKRKDLEEKK